MPDDLREVTKCEICGDHELSSVLQLGEHPMCDDLVPTDDLRECKLYPIEILFCKTCYTAHQRYQIPKHDLFPQQYHYRSRNTADVLEGMAQLVTSVESEFGSLSTKKVADIGCNDGSLLDIFRSRGANTFGIEPTGAADEARENGHTVVHDYFSKSSAEKFVEMYGHPDIITFTNVFAHIEDMNDIIDALNVMRHEETMIVIENHYLGSVLSKKQFDTFYHEHPRTYSFRSFIYIANAIGVQVRSVTFPRRYGGNIRVMLGGSGSAQYKSVLSLHELAELEQNFYSQLLSLSKDITEWRERKLAELMQAVKQHGPLRAKAFPGRAAIPLKLLGLTHSEISAVYEKPQSIKVGHYVPGTRIPIISDKLLLENLENGVPIVNFAWHISDEIRSYMTEQGYDGEIIDIISASDFSDI